MTLCRVYELSSASSRVRFQWVREPTSAQLTQLAHTIARRVGRLLEREGLLERDTEQLDLGKALDYICRRPVSEKRLFRTPRGDIGNSLKTLYRDGTIHVILEPLDFIARLACLCVARRQAALVPPPRLNLTRFHGVFALNSPYDGADGGRGRTSITG